MDGPRSIAGVPTLTIARVIGQNSEDHTLIIQLPSTQIVGFPCRVLFNGPADMFRVEQKPLPITGTWGLVAFPYGDNRIGLWLGSYYMSYVDAITSSPTDIDCQMDYSSHFSGQYHLLDALGNYFQRWPDGTNIILGTSETPPTFYRHVLASDAASSEVVGAGENTSPVRQRIVYSDSDRNANPPSPYFVEVNHVTGAQVKIDPQGNITLTSANQTGTVIQLDQAGNLNAIGPNAGAVINFGGGIVLQSGGATLAIVNGIVEVNPPIINYSVATLGSITP